MTPRPRSIADAELLRAAATVLAERGLEQLRLADVAAASQLAAPTLVQRFGSREGLLDALAGSFVGEVSACFANPGRPILSSLADAMHRLESARHIGFFMARPARAPSYALELRKQIGLALAAAVDAGELAPCDVASMGRRLQLAYLGLVSTALLEAVPVSLDRLHVLIEESLADYR